MKRREFITLVGGAAAAWPLAARAQQSPNRIPVVGELWHAGSAEEEDVYLNVLVKAFNDLGYVEGKTFIWTIAFLPKSGSLPNIGARTGR
jgi:putative tryptophan/tyrosine transport system substrate-binding protein